MKRYLTKSFLMSTVMIAIAIIASTASAQNYKLTRVAEYDKYERMVTGFDKNCQPVMVGLNGITDGDGYSIKYTILDADFKPVHSFTIKNLKCNPEYDVYKHATDMDWHHYEGFYYYDNPVYAVQGLLDDDNIWCVSITENPGGYGEGTKRAFYDENGNVIFNIEHDSHSYGDNHSLLWSCGRWFVKYAGDDSTSEGVYTLRTNNSAGVSGKSAGQSTPKGTYTLNGVKVNKPKKGYYIVDGKKVVR